MSSYHPNPEHPKNHLSVCLALMLLDACDGKANVRVVHFASTLAPDRFDIKKIGIAREQPQ